jgi:hypothetical protein
MLNEKTIHRIFDVKSDSTQNNKSYLKNNNNNGDILCIIIAN